MQEANNEGGDDGVRVERGDCTAPTITSKRNSSSLSSLIQRGGRERGGWGWKRGCCGEGAVKKDYDAMLNSKRLQFEAIISRDLFSLSPADST